MKDRQAILKQIMQPREKIMYEAEIHGSAYLPAVLLGLLGVVTLFPVEAILPELSERYGAAAGQLLSTMREFYIGGVFIIMAIGIAVKTHHAKKHHIHAITNMRVLEITGAMTHHVQEIALKNIQRVKVGRLLFDRLLFRGDITITEKRDHDHEHDIIIKNVHEPVKFKKTLLQAKERFK